MINRNTSRSRILVYQEYYLPGFKAGGTLRAVANLVEWLGDELEFFLITRDRDLGATAAYSNVLVGTWNRVGKGMVYYCPPSLGMSWRIWRLFRDVKPDVIILNGYFDSFTIRLLALRRFGLFRKVPIVLVVHGALSPGALQLKARKKRLYIRLTLGLGMYRGIFWQATTDIEREDILRVVGKGVLINVASCLPTPMRPSVDRTERSLEKTVGAVRFVFLSRISPKKNLLYLLDALAGLSADVTFDIIGPITDEAYWESCQSKLTALPTNIHVTYRGTVPDVIAAFEQYHFFLFPTLSENFGYVILEAWAGGCPVVISDCTPWKELTPRQLGWEIPLESPSLWHTRLQECVDMDGPTFAAMSRAARQFADDWMADPSARQQNLDLLAKAIGSRALDQ